MTIQHQSLARVIAILYLGLLPLSIRVRGQFYAQDLLAPVILGLAALDWRRWRQELTRPPAWLLAGFLTLAGVAVLCHPSRADFYEFAIFGYLAMVFWFFRNTVLERRLLLAYGLGVLLVFCVYAAGEALAGMRVTHGVYAGSTLDFLARRFFFRFPHPNLAGSYYVLPVVCILLGARALEPRADRVRWGGRVLLFGIVCVPLLLTMSRHMLLTFAVVLGFLVDRAAPTGRPVRRGLAVAVLLGVFALFLLTVLFPFFPLGRAFPFFNCATPGMYMVHQEIYFRLVFLDLRSLLLGVGRHGVLHGYRELADPGFIHAVLSQYRQTALVPGFASYMDAHNEYLNLATSFGVPAMLCGFAFWAVAGADADGCPDRELLGFFVAAVFMVACWDDILSKRWIWATLGILAAPGREPGGMTNDE